jgi:hypothetical protein
MSLKNRMSTAISSIEDRVQCVNDTAMLNIML